MRWSAAAAATFAVLAPSALVAAQSPSPSSSARAACAFACHAADLLRVDLAFATTHSDALVCSFGADEVQGACTYDPLTGALVRDDNAGACPRAAVRQCASKRFNVVRAIAERRAARPQASVPDLTKLRRRAALKRSHD